MANKIQIKLLDKSAKIPTRCTTHSAGYDMFLPKDINLLPYQIMIVDMGISLAIPNGYYMTIYVRSSIANRGICLANSVGVIDADYRGEVKLMLINHFNTPSLLKSGDRVAQMVLNRIEELSFEAVDLLKENESNRTGGFGSTGM